MRTSAHASADLDVSNREHKRYGYVQAGDPSKAADAILDAVAAAAPTLRLPLGSDAVAAIRSTLAAVAADVDRNERTARATVIDG